MSCEEELSELEKHKIIQQFGIFVDETARLVECNDDSQHIGEPTGSPLSPADPPLKSKKSPLIKSGKINLQSIHAKSKEIGVPLLAVGSFYEDAVQPESPNKHVIYALELGDLEACVDYSCLPKTSEKFISTALTALEHNIKAVLVKPSLARWCDEPADFSSFNFAVAVKKLLAKNYKLEYRDEESRRSNEAKALEEQENKGDTPCLSAAKAKESPEFVYQVDPFHPTTPRQIWIHVSVNEDECKSSSEILSAENLHDQAWNWWSDLQTYTEINPKLALCLELGSAFPDDVKRVQRWLGERLRAISIRANVWRKNKAGFPILPQRLKNFIVKSFHLPQVTYLVAEGTRNRDHFLYLLHLYKDYLKSLKDPLCQKLMRHLADVPIRPLQPLRDHLTQEIYSVFEADPIKYKLYHDASYFALQDLKDAGRGSDSNHPIVAMVVGAGRGPLVTQFITAAVSLGIFFKVYALDKNPIAISAMMAKLEDVWRPYASFIHIVQHDMRNFNPEDKADILISELLGSFACNELSPECLDGAQRLLKPDGVSIPCSYSNYLQPVMAVSLYQDLATFAPKKRKILNEFVLVEMRSFVEIAPYQQAFTFHHPNFESHSNARDVQLTFDADNDYRLTGFAGYFDLNLFKDVSMNILPDQHTVGLTSWFPAFFGLARPVDVKKGDKIVFHIGRRVSEENRRVWYVWSLLQPEMLPIQNATPDNWISM